MAILAWWPRSRHHTELVTMKAHHLYSTAMTLAAAALLATPSPADQTISDTQTKAVTMTEGKLTVTGTGFLNVVKNAVNLKDPIRSALEIEVMEGGGISGKSALVLDQGMEDGVAGQLISLTNSGIMTGTEKQAIDLRYMLHTSATITNNGTISAGQKGAVKLGNNATVINNGTIETTAAGENGITAKNYDPEDDGIDTFAHGLDLTNNMGGKIIGIKHGVTGEGEAGINNNGRIEGRGGSGLNWDWNAALQQDDKYVVTVVNGKDGVITGTGDAASLDGDGVDVDYIVNLTNSGTIIAKDSFGSADGLAIGGGTVTNTGTITASNSNANGQAYGILVDDSDGGNAFEAIRITNSGTIEGTGGNGVGIRIVSDKENYIFMEGGTITGGSGQAVIMGSGDDVFSYSGGTVNGSVDGGEGFNTMIFRPADTDLTFSSDLKNFNSISIQGSSLSPGASVTLENLTITLDMASLSQDTPLFSLEGNSITAGSLQFNNAVLQLMGTPDALPLDDSGMIYFKLAGDGISLEGLEVRTEGGYELDMSRDGYVGINFSTPEPAAATLGLLGFSLSMLRRRRPAA